MWEMTVLHALKLRGAEVRYVGCDGLYSECDVFWKSTNPRDSLSCTRCQAHVATLICNMSMSSEWLGRYLMPEEFREARRWSDGVELGSLGNARYAAWDVGEWVKSSVHSHLRVSYLDFAVPEIEAAYRSYLYSGLVACFGLNRFLDDSRPDVLFLFSGRMSSSRVALELALRRGIRVVCHERGLLRESLKLFENVSSVSLRPFPELWSDWGDVALREDQLETVSRYMAGRAEGRNIGERTFSPTPGDLQDIRDRLGLRPERRVWLLFTSSEDEVIATAERQGPFPTQIDWIRATVRYAERQPEIDLILRVHPNIGGKRSIGTNAGQLEEIEKLRAELPSNVRMVMPDDPVSSYSLMDIAELGLVYISITGLEMACKGKQIVVAAGAWVRGLPFVQTVDSIDTYHPLLDAALDSTEPGGSTEIQRLAYRFAYSLYFRWNIPFPLVEMPDPQTGRLAYDSLRELLPGREQSLDRVCRVILEGEAICPSPGAQDRSASLEDERAWVEAHWTSP